MDSFLRYLIESGICLITLYCFFILFLRKEQFFNFNRFYLIGTMIFSLIIPIIKIKTDTPVIFNTGNLIIPQTSIDTVDITVHNGFVFLDILPVLYFIISLMLLILFIVKLSKLFFMIRRNVVVLKVGINLVQIEHKYTPFSFLNYIFINKYHDDDESNRIIEHELAHIRQYHTIDLILSELYSIFQWFNPVVYFFRKSLKEQHEFIADKMVLDNGYDLTEYQQLILKQTYSNVINNFTNAFRKSQIERRFLMMSTKLKSKLNLLKLSLLIPVIGLLVFTFSCTKESNNDDLNFFRIRNNNLIDGDGIIIDENGKQQKPDRFPEPRIGIKQLYKFVSDNLQYPDEAMKNNIAGKVHVLIQIDENGKISSPKITSVKPSDGPWGSKLGYGCDEEALRLANLIPDFVPAMFKGKTYKSAVTIPMMFGSQEIFDLKNPPTIIVETIEKPEDIRDSKLLNENISFDSSPEFPGGYTKMVDFISKNIKYPESAKKNNISGTVYTSLIVDETGKLTNIKIEKGINKDFNNEALRVLKLMPDWEPAGKNGKKLKYKVTLPIKFKLE